jgi:hypothetical protein
MVYPREVAHARRWRAFAEPAPSQVNYDYSASRASSISSLLASYSPQLGASCSLAFRLRIDEFVYGGLPAILEARAAARLGLKLNSLWHSGFPPFCPDVRPDAY